MPDLPFRPDLGRSWRLFQAFRVEQTDPAHFYGTLARDSVDQIRTYAELDGRWVLDVGGGPGYFADAFRSAGATYTPLDADLGELSGLGDPEPGTVLGSGMQLPFADDSFGVTYSSNVLEHVSEPWTMADEMVRVTEPGGLVFLSYTLWYGPWGGHETSPVALPRRPPRGAALREEARPPAQERVRDVALPGHRGRRAALGAPAVHRRGGRRDPALPAALVVVGPAGAGPARAGDVEPRDRVEEDVSDEPVEFEPAAPTLTAVWRFRLAACCLALVALAFAQAPGNVVTDTKLDLTVDPVGFLGRALSLWDSQGAFGQVQNQAYGYLFPMGPFFALGHLADVSPWVTQRLWWSLLLVVAFLGTVVLLGAMGIGNRWTRILAGFAFALSPRMLSVLGASSVEMWPSALAPWVLVPLVIGLVRGDPRRQAALSALAVAHGRRGQRRGDVRGRAARRVVDLVRAAQPPAPHDDAVVAAVGPGRARCGGSCPCCCSGATARRSSTTSRRRRTPPSRRPCSTRCAARPTGWRTSTSTPTRATC